MIPDHGEHLKVGRIFACDRQGAVDLDEGEEVDHPSYRVHYVPAAHHRKARVEGVALARARRP